MLSRFFTLHSSLFTKKILHSSARPLQGTLALQKARIFTLHLYAAMLLMLFTACSKGNYVNNLPKNAVCLLSVNGERLVGAYSPFNVLLMPFVNDEKTQLKGIDLTKDIYFFETSDGMFGSCAPIADDYDFHDFITRLSNIGGVGEVKREKDLNYCFYKKQWILAYNDYCLIVMGPVLDSETEKQKLLSRIVSQMDDKEETSCQGSELWEHLNETNAPVRFVAKASALPQQIVNACTFGAPRGTDPEDVFLEAQMRYEDGTLYMSGSTCSPIPHVRQALKKANYIYRPITIDWKKEVSDTAVSTMFLNVDGREFAQNIDGNKSLAMILRSTGAYSTIAENNGDMVITMSPKGGNFIENGISATVRTLPKGNIKSKERFVAVFNTEKIIDDLAPGNLLPIGKVKRIVFVIDDNKD